MPLTDEGVPFLHRETSREAAESVADSVAALRLDVYRSILRADQQGKTCDELEMEFGRLHEIVWVAIPSPKFQEQPPQDDGDVQRLITEHDGTSL